MKNNVLLAAVAAALFAPGAFAQSGTFEGLRLGLNMNMNSSTTEFSLGSEKLNGLGSTEVGTSLQAAYGWGLSRSAVLSLGATYSLNEIGSGDFYSSTNPLRLRKRDAYAIYVEPGFKVSTGTLAYARLGYENASLLAESQGVGVSRTVDGYSGGLGLRALLDQHIYLQAEVLQVFYNSANLGSPGAELKSSATVGTIGLGYQF